MPNPSPTETPHPPERSADASPLWLDFSPWSFWTDATPEQRAAQRTVLEGVRAAGHRLGDDVFISATAATKFDSLVLGDRSYIAAHCYLSGEIAFGSDCTLNPFSIVRGRVTIGDGVRIGAHTSIVGFNHGTDPGIVPLWTQAHTSKGITIADDVWVGSNVTILDGVAVGAHSIIAAGAVVTKDVPEWALVGGNPARLIRDRRTARASSPRPGRSARLHDFAARARDDIPNVLERSWDGEWFRDAPDRAVTVRAQGDAVELADLAGLEAPAPLTREQHVDRLVALQQVDGGLVPEFGASPQVTFADGAARYHVLSTGYALDLLGARFPHPIAVVHDLGGDELTTMLGRLDWAGRAWGSGATIDELGTALLWELRAGRPPQSSLIESLFGWLGLHADPATGVWGDPTPDEGMLQPVNGFYRASRGTYAQFGVPVPNPRVVIDTVLRHAADPAIFAPGRENACNVLDIAHPLWLCGGQEPAYRRAEVVALAEEHIDRVLERWVPGQGVSFAAANAREPDARRTAPGLQGTEMWLATLWLLADLAGDSTALGYRPRGVHRPEPALLLAEALGRGERR